MIGNVLGAKRTTTVVPVVVLWIFAASFLAFLFLQDSIPYEVLLLDPNVAATTPWYAGLLWGFSLLGWATATVAATAAGWICRLASRNRAAAMLTRGAVLSAVLLADNLFQLGQRFAAVFGFPEVTFFVGCMMAFGLWAYIEREELQRTRVELVVTSIVALLSALLMRTIAPSIFGIENQRALIAASAAEFLGVLAWAQYFLLTGTDIVRSIFINLRAKSMAPEAHKPVDLGQPKSVVTTTRRERSTERART